MVRTVLVVDDSPTIRGFVRLVLRGVAEVLEADDGPAGLAACKKAAPGLVLVDLNMPEMDGLAFTRALRAQPGLQALPVLLLTGERDEGLRQSGLAAGANDLVLKPIQPQALQAVVKRWLGEG